MEKENTNEWVLQDKKKRKDYKNKVNWFLFIFVTVCILSFFEIMIGIYSFTFFLLVVIIDIFVKKRISIPVSTNTGGGVNRYYFGNKAIIKSIPFIILFMLFVYLIVISRGIYIYNNENIQTLEAVYILCGIIIGTTLGSYYNKTSDLEWHIDTYGNKYRRKQ